MMSHLILKVYYPATLKIYVTPGESFSIIPNDVFQLTPPTFDNVSGYNKFLTEPDMRDWSQQLNFATYCATSGCGISYDIIGGKNTNSVYIMWFIILFGVGVPLPWKNNFNWVKTSDVFSFHYVSPS